MTELNQDFKMIAGDHKRLVFDVTGVDPTTASAVYWFGGDKIEKTTADMNITADSITFDILPNETVNMRDKYRHELKIVDNNENVSTISRGFFTVIDTENIII